MFGLTGQEADIKSLEQTVVLKLQEISKLRAKVGDLEAELHGTVTTKYHDAVVLGATNRHDQIVAEACKLQAENDKLQAVVDAGNAVMRSYKYKNAGWGVSGVYAELEQSIKEVK